MTITSYGDDDDDDVSSVSSIDSLEYRSKQEEREIPQKNEATTESYREMRKKESKRKLQEWVETKRAFTGLLDATGASILEVHGRKLKLSKPGLFSRLTALLWQCRRKNCLSYFTHPGGEECEGGMVAFENRPGLTRQKDEQEYATKCCIAIEQYNNNMNNEQSSKLEFCSFIRVAYSFGCELYITFTAWQNGQLGTFQAVVDDDWLGDGDVFLVLLRHLDADKIIAIMSLSGVEEEWEQMFGKDWKLRPY